MIDYIRLLDDYGAPYALEGPNVGTQFIGVNCPWCDDDSFHGGLPRNGMERYTCWRCGGHNVKYTLSRILGIPNIEEILRLYDDGFVSDVVTREVDTYRPDYTVVMPGGPLEWYHRKYLESRRYDPSFLERKYGLTGTHPLSDYGSRVYAPIYHKGELVSFQGRAVMKGVEPKYMAARPSEERMLHKHVLYNQDNCTKDFIVLVEGVYDVFRLGDNAAATFGTAFSPHQLLHVKQYDRVFMLYDSEGDAQARAKDAAGLMATLVPDVAIVDIGQGDPDDLGDDDAAKLMAEIGRKVF